MKSFFPFLGSPGRIGALELKNRIVMPAMGTAYATEEGFITGRQIAYYVERAKGGAGLIISGHVGIADNGRAHDKMKMLSDDRYIAGFRDLVEGVHRAGAKIAIQLNHAGRQIHSKGPMIVSHREYVPVAPSAIPSPQGHLIPRALSTGELPVLARQWAEAAGRVRKSGADGIEIHMAHGYLPNQFLSPLSNLRKDIYGGSLEGRLKFPLEVFRAIRQEVGPDFPVWCRLSGSEFVEGGIELEATKKIAAALEKEGADALHISAGISQGSIHMVHPCYYFQDAPLIHLAEAVKSVVHVPVIAVGKIKDPVMADRFIQEKRCDLVAMGRTLIADPYFPKKSFEGHGEEILPCISCNRCIRSIRESSLQCAVNPRVGREYEVYPKAAKECKKVFIIGGEVAGLKAAEMCAKSGHRVTLAEKQNFLGGQVNRGMIPPGKIVLSSFLGYLERQARKAGVDIELGVEVNDQYVMERHPDVVVIATGGKPFIPDLPGRAKAHLLTFEDILRPEPAVGEKILILGGGSLGAEMADYLASRGKEVTVVEMREEIAYDAVAHLKYCLLERLSTQKVKILTHTKVVAFDKDSVIVEDPGGRKELRGYDSLVIAMGLKSSETLASHLRGKVKRIFVIGDAHAPREIMDAVQEAYEISLNLLN